ncbi:MAG: winged helix-turn-helix domain-containing protein [Flavobacteriaceae bacterium]|nr:winged helix-turn-helix domain-containing protein [Flavobacteriaceae bacterium]MCY4266321.1 winged helix-turn-helix domain-containing protein [Flavobacteriaceae bacterium]
MARSPIDRLLKRHHWRQVVPRPDHPQKNPKRQEGFKKKRPERVKAIIKKKQWDQEQVLFGV